MITTQMQRFQSAARAADSEYKEQEMNLAHQA
jgi:hypothetical protein